MVKLRPQRVRKKDPAKQLIRSVGRCNADYGHRYAIELDGLAYDLRIGVKLVFPQWFAQHGHLRLGSGGAIARGKKTPHQRMIDSEYVKVVACGQQCGDIPVFLFKNSGILPPRRHLTEGVGTVANRVIILTCEIRDLICSCEPSRIPGKYLYETRGVNARWTPEKRRIHNREHASV